MGLPIGFYQGAERRSVPKTIRERFQESYERIGSQHPHPRQATKSEPREADENKMGEF